MKVNELSKELNITNKDLITFLKDNGFKISSHMQTVTDEMVDVAKERFKNSEDEVDETDEDYETEEKGRNPVKKFDMRIPSSKTYELDELIPCKSVTPWKLIELGADRRTVYSWAGYGDIDYVAYKDLQTMRRKDILRKPKVIIEDAELCYRWRRDLGETYKHFLNVEYPEEFFDLSDNKFKDLLLKAPDVLKEVIKFTAMNMVRNENYPSVHKINILDEVLGTKIKDFL